MRNLATARERPPDPNAPAVRREETELFLSTMGAPDGLRPDVMVERSDVISLPADDFRRTLRHMP